MTQTRDRPATRIRVGQAAEMLGVSIETLRRWETDGRLRMERSDGGQRLIEIDEVARLLEERRRASTDRPIVAQSARNRFPGIVTRVERDGVAAVVEVIAGPHRMVSLMTAEAVDELDLKVGDEAVCVVKSTNVIVEIPSSRGITGLRSRLTIPLATVALVLIACSNAGAAAPSAAQATPAATGEVSASANLELTVFGAASLKGVLDKAKAAYETAYPGTTMAISTDSSSALEMQIEQGAPADVFLSADTTNPKKLVDGGFADGAAVTFAGNKLTVIVPAANPAGITTPADLAKPGVKVIAAGPEVPITKYATQLVANLAKEAGYPADFAAKYAGNVASREDNVKAVVAKIELGEGDAGIVYVTDAKASTKVTPIDIPDTANVPATYAGVVVKASKIAAAGKTFLDWFAGPGGQAILGEFGVPATDVIEGVGGRSGGSRAVGDHKRSSTARARGWGDRSIVAVAGLFALFLGLPVLALVGRALLDGSLGVAITTPVVLDALVLSLVTTAISLVITVVFGLPFAFVLARRTFRGKSLLEAVVDLPIVLPPSVAGLALLLVFGRRGLLSAPFELLGISVPFTTIAVILAMTFVSAPFFIRSARNGIAGVDGDLEDAARVDGASERQLFRSITVPLASAALAAGLVMTWARSLGEFGATIMFAGNIQGRTQTLPLVVYSQFQGGDLDASIAAAAILVMAAFGVLVAVRVFHWGRIIDARGLG